MATTPPLHHQPTEQQDLFAGTVRLPMDRVCNNCGGKSAHAVIPETYTHGAIANALPGIPRCRAATASDAVCDPR